jgi:hypothetical protein
MQRNKAPWLLHRNIVQINVIDPHHAMQYKTKNNNNKSFFKSQKSLCMDIPSQYPPGIIRKNDFFWPMPS